MISGISSPVFSFHRAYPAAKADAAPVSDEAKAESPENAKAAGKAGAAELSEAEQRQVEELRQADKTVRQHEQMHVAAGGDLVTSGPSYSYTTGPDGQRYAVAGEVGIDTSKEDNPEDTLSKARRIRSAALAPPDPSGQDRQVAALASQMEMEALQEIARQRQSAAPEGGASGEEGSQGGAEAGGAEAAGSQAYRRMMAGDPGQANGVSAYA
ncbi:putative metalloprotease CJM1_0395 family protein [Azovibrio restrictus]|uniref:putative metalloprotease CJM1_0395 family protein n=1 Tax=Azovibrio restrictus TaxID=146938 RepID=UPI0026EC6A23|nr:putative metalloprotease CJM1_0395 family protein [Azovibrio restrictus]MDD3482031.1 putative metalloprotease CJM1_0395 family protein [Azovibrio restrictus]